MPNSFFCHKMDNIRTYTPTDELTQNKSSRLQTSSMFDLRTSDLAEIIGVKYLRIRTNLKSPT